MDSLDEKDWTGLLTRIFENEVVPVVGPGAVTFGDDNQLLYPWLAQRLTSELDPPLAMAEPPRSLQEVVDAQRMQRLPVDRIYKRLSKIVEPTGLQPGRTLRELAEIKGFKLFVSATFDPLLPRAVERVPPASPPEGRHAAATLRNPCPDLPPTFPEANGGFVYQILGRAEPVRDFVVWDDDLVHFLLRLNHQLPKLPRLNEELQKSHFLVLGLSLSDWLLRFFVQVVKQQRLSELAGTELLISERLEPTERDKVVVYFSRLTQQVKILPTDPVDFISELNRRWFERYPRTGPDLPPPPELPPLGSIFISYARTDFQVAEYIVRQLRAAGCLVWFDEQLNPGERWETVLRQAIDQRCGLFLSLISEQSAARVESYATLERNVAASRQLRFAGPVVFYIPVRIDLGEPLIASNEPPDAMGSHGVRKDGGHLDAAFIAYLRQKQRENCRALGYPLPPD